MKVKNHRNFAFTNYNQKSQKRLGEIVKRTNEEGETEIGVIIQNHGDGEYRIDTWGNCSESEIKTATKAEIQKYAPEYLKYIDKDEPRFDYWKRTIRIFNEDVSIQAIDVNEAEKEELREKDLIFYDGKKWKFNDNEAMKEWLVSNKVEVKIINGLERYPEFKDLVTELANEVCAKINEKAKTIKSDMPYKTQFTLEEVIRELESRV